MQQLLFEAFSFLWMWRKGALCSNRSIPSSLTNPQYDAGCCSTMLPCQALPATSPSDTAQVFQPGQREGQVWIMCMDLGQKQAKKRFTAQQHTKHCGFGGSGHTEQTSKMWATNACTYGTDNIQFYSTTFRTASKQWEMKCTLLRPAQILPRNTAICWVKQMPCINTDLPAPSLGAVLQLTQLIFSSSCSLVSPLLPHVPTYSVLTEFQLERQDH